MKTRISTILLATALIAVLTVTPAHAIFGAITGALQRAQMIINQGIQIYEQQIAKLTMDGQLTELTSQFDHLKEQAMGSVGQLTQPFTDLSSAPAKLIGNGISWKNEFTGVAGEFVSSIEQLGETGTSFTDSWRSRIQGQQYRLRNRRAESLCGFSPGGCGPRFRGLPCGPGGGRQTPGPQPCGE